VLKFSEKINKGGEEAQKVLPYAAAKLIGEYNTAKEADKTAIKNKFDGIMRLIGIREYSENTTDKNFAMLEEKAKYGKANYGKIGDINFSQAMDIENFNGLSAVQAFARLVDIFKNVLISPSTTVTPSVASTVVNSPAHSDDEEETDEEETKGKTPDTPEVSNIKSLFAKLHATTLSTMKKIKLPEAKKLKPVLKEFAIANKIYPTETEMKPLTENGDYKKFIKRVIVEYDKPVTPSDETKK
jgi:hypothetical protein